MKWISAWSFCGWTKSKKNSYFKLEFLFVLLPFIWFGRLRSTIIVLYMANCFHQDNFHWKQNFILYLGCLFFLLNTWIYWPDSAFLLPLWISLMDCTLWLTIWADIGSTYIYIYIYIYTSQQSWHSSQCLCCVNVKNFQISLNINASLIHNQAEHIKHNYPDLVKNISLHLSNQVTLGISMSKEIISSIHKINALLIGGRIFQVDHLQKDKTCSPKRIFLASDGEAQVLEGWRVWSTFSQVLQTESGCPCYGSIRSGK